MHITKFVILGERCSGTNFLEESIIHNFNITYTQEYGNKHFFCFNSYPDKNLTDDTLFIGIIRNPIYWLNSFSKELHHVPECNKHSIYHFLFNNFYSVVENGKNKKVNLDMNTIHNILNRLTPHNKILIKEDLNYLTGKKYKNIFELRQIKNNYLMNVMSNKVNNYILINYEDLLYNFEKTVTIIKDKYNLVPKMTFFQKVKKYKKNSSYNFVQQRQIMFSHDIIELIWQNLDVEQESKLGYLKFDDNGFFKNKYIENQNDEQTQDNIPLMEG